MTQPVTAHVAVSSRVHTSWVFTRSCTPSVRSVCSQMVHQWWQPAWGYGFVPATWGVGCCWQIPGSEWLHWELDTQLVVIHSELSDWIMTHIFPKTRGSSLKSLQSWPPLTVMHYCYLTWLCMVLALHLYLHGTAWLIQYNSYLTLFQPQTNHAVCSYLCWKCLCFSPR